MGAIDSVCVATDAVFAGGTSAAGSGVASFAPSVTSAVDVGRLFLVPGEEVPVWAARLERRSPTRLSMKLSRSCRSLVRVGRVDTT